MPSALQMSDCTLPNNTNMTLVRNVVFLLCILWFGKNGGRGLRRYPVLPEILVNGLHTAVEKNYKSMHTTSASNVRPTLLLLHLNEPWPDPRHWAALMGSKSIWIVIEWKCFGLLDQNSCSLCTLFTLDLSVVIMLWLIQAHLLPYLAYPAEG